MKNFIARLYYLLIVAFRLPYSRFFQKKIVKKLHEDWFANKENYLDFQKKNFQKIKKRAYKVSYYKNKLKLGELLLDSEIEDFPIIDKSVIRNNKLSSSNPLLPHNKMNTGGSTGSPLYFYTSPKVRELEFAHQLFFYERIGYKRGDLIYTIDGTRLNKEKLDKNCFWNVYKFKNFPYGLIHFTTTVLDKSTAKYYIDKILDDKPAFIRGYPSGVSLLASYILQENLESSFTFIKGIMLTSENITKEQIETCSLAFNCSIFPQYGMTEASVFAFTEPNSLKYYCSPFYGITEVLKEDGNHCEIGETGELVVTGFGNSYQPFIRYKTGDIAEYGGVYRGFVVLNELFGRRQDYIVDIDGKRIMLVGLIFGAHLKSFEAIISWQIKQDVKGEVNITINPNNKWNLELEEEINKTISCDKKITVNVIYGDRFELTKSGKRPFVIQNVK